MLCLLVKIPVDLGILDHCSVVGFELGNVQLAQYASLWFVFFGCVGICPLSQNALCNDQCYAVDCRHRSLRLKPKPETTYARVPIMRSLVKYIVNS